MPFVWDTTVRLLEVLPDVPEAYWRWKEGETPMGESGRVFGAVGAYLVAIALGRLAMQNRKPFGASSPHPAPPAFRFDAMTGRQS